jgi:hypothetical protein
MNGCFGGTIDSGLYSVVGSKIIFNSDCEEQELPDSIVAPMVSKLDYALLENNDLYLFEKGFVYLDDSKVLLKKVKVNN